MKNTMKQMMLAAALLTAPLAMAQEGAQKQQHREKDPKAMAEKRTEHMKEALGLSPEQVEKVKAINLAHAEKMSAIRQQENKEEKQKNMQQLREWRLGELKTVLTADQIAKLEEMKAQRKGERERKGQGRPAQRTAPSTDQ